MSANVDFVSPAERKTVRSSETILNEISLIGTMPYFAGASFAALHFRASIDAVSNPGA